MTGSIEPEPESTSRVVRFVVAVLGVLVIFLLIAVLRNV